MSSESDNHEDNKNTRRDFIKKVGATALGAASIVAAPGIVSANTSKESKSLPLSGRTALITGGARGIGRAIAEKLSSQGANIVVLDIAEPNAMNGVTTYKLASPNDLQETENAITNAGGTITAIKADVRDRNAMQLAAQTAIDTYGGLDIVVANAAIATTEDRFENENENKIKQTMDVNVIGVANTISATIPALKQSKSQGRIIAISSIAGRMGVPNIATYCASKWAVIGLIKSLCLELGEDNITANCIAPTGVKTSMLLGTNPNDLIGDLNESALDLYLKQKYHSLNKGLLEPSDIADAVAFLASDEAKYISGITLDVNAGLSGRITG